MSSTTTMTRPDHASGSGNGFPFDDWFDPIEAGLRDRVRGFIEAMNEAELEEVLGRARYVRRADGAGVRGAGGHGHGRRRRTLAGTFGATEIAVPRARLAGEDGATTEWKSKAFRKGVESSGA